MPDTTPNATVLVVGASRGLGQAIVETYAARGATVVATVRGTGRTPLHDALDSLDAHDAHDAGSIEIETVDITDSAQLAALGSRLEGRTFDLLFIVAGVSLAPQDAPATAISTADFETMMVTNSLAVMRTIDALEDVVDPAGTIAVMSSGQGSITNNTRGGFEVYRATKAALNQLMRSYAARQEGTPGADRALLLLAPGWVRTGMGGGGAPLSIEESIPPLVDTVDAQRGRSGLQYLDRHGNTIPW